jgi:hypothetical protein
MVIPLAYTFSPKTLRIKAPWEAIREVTGVEK